MKIRLTVLDEQSQLVLNGADGFRHVIEPGASQDFDLPANGRVLLTAPNGRVLPMLPRDMEDGMMQHAERAMLRKNAVAGLAADLNLDFASMRLPPADELAAAVGHVIGVENVDRPDAAVNGAVQDGSHV